MSRRSVAALSLLLALLLPLQVLSQGDLDLADALDSDAPEQPPTPTKPRTPAGGAGGELSLDDFFNDATTTTTKAPPKVVPKVPKPTKAPAKPKPKPAGDEFDLADALNPDNDIRSRDKNKKKGGGFSDDDLLDVSKDDTYKPDKGKGGRFSEDQVDQRDDNNETTAEVGTIAGIVSAVAMALVGAISSYISYQKKKLCFSMQQSLNTEMTKAENPEAVVASEPQVQQTLLEHPNAEPPAAGNTV